MPAAGDKSNAMCGQRPPNGPSPVPLAESQPVLAKGHMFSNSVKCNISNTYAHFGRRKMLPEGGGRGGELLNKYPKEYSPPHTCPDKRPENTQQLLNKYTRKSCLSAFHAPAAKFEQHVATVVRFGPKLAIFWPNVTTLAKISPEFGGRRVKCTRRRLPGVSFE